MKNKNRKKDKRKETNQVWQKDRNMKQVKQNGCHKKTERIKQLYEDCRVFYYRKVFSKLFTKSGTTVACSIFA